MKAISVDRVTVPRVQPVRSAVLPNKTNADQHRWLAFNTSKGGVMSRQNTAMMPEKRCQDEKSDRPHDIIRVTKLIIIIKYSEAMATTEGIEIAQ